MCIRDRLWTGPVVVNVDWLRSLPADVQQAIIEAGHETTVEMRALLDKQESASREMCIRDRYKSGQSPFQTYPNSLSN